MFGDNVFISIVNFSWWSAEEVHGPETPLVCPKNFYGRFSGDTIIFESPKQRHLENFREQTSITELSVRNFTNVFRARKVFGTLKETGPSSAGGVRGTGVSLFGSPAK